MKDEIVDSNEKNSVESKTREGKEGRDSFVRLLCDDISLMGWIMLFNS